MNPAGRARAALKRGLYASHGVLAMYSTASVNVMVRVRPGKFRCVVRPEETFRPKAEYHDWMMLVESLQFEPKEGHRVRILSTGQTFELTSPSADEQAARHTDTSQTEWRLHSVRLHD